MKPKERLRLHEFQFHQQKRPGITMHRIHARIHWGLWTCRDSVLSERDLSRCWCMKVNRAAVVVLHMEIIRLRDIPHRMSAATTDHHQRKLANTASWAPKFAASSL